MKNSQESCLYSWCETACKLDGDVTFVSHHPWCFGSYSCSWVIHAQKSSLTCACVTPTASSTQEAERRWSHIFGPSRCSASDIGVFVKTSSSTKCCTSYSEIWHLAFSTICPVGKEHKDCLSIEMSGFRSTPEVEDYRIQTMYLLFCKVF